MKTKVFYCVAGAVVLAISAFICFNPKKEISFCDENVEALADGESAPFCYSGGHGAMSCSIEGGIQILNNGVSTKCEVSCRDGYYACCGIGCKCIEEDQL